VATINVLVGAARASLIERTNDIARYVAENAGSGDIVLVMSNGGFDGVQDKILEALTLDTPCRDAKDGHITIDR
jgi:UDP-N-acetylmuramate-alanine ligase